MMNILSLQAQNPIRRSERRRNKKICKQNKHYEIPNPYKTPQSQRSLPGKLSSQLSKLDFLSEKNLKQIEFNLPVLTEELPEMLEKMREAALSQENQLQAQLITVCQYTNKGTIDSEGSGRCWSSESSSIEVPNGNLFQDESEEENFMFYEQPSIEAACLREEFENYLI